MSTLAYRTAAGICLQAGGLTYRLPQRNWDSWINRDDLAEAVEREITELTPAPADFLKTASLQAPLQSQEVWAAGVTDFRSRDARMEESRQAGGDDFYDRVYDAERPELFFKSTPHRTVGPGGQVALRSDARWNVPEPELALVVTSSGKIVRYTIGNDMSSRDIEGENPLYLPQAKVYDRSCAPGTWGAGLFPTFTHHNRDIALEIERESEPVFQGRTSLKELKRSPRELVDYLYRDNSFPHGCVLLTGTGVIPPHDFTLKKGDRISISIDGIGTLSNQVG